MPCQEPASESALLVGERQVASLGRQEDGVVLPDRLSGKYILSQRDRGSMNLPGKLAFSRISGHNCQSVDPFNQGSIRSSRAVFLFSGSQTNIDRRKVRNAALFVPSRCLSESSREIGGSGGLPLQLPVVQNVSLPIHPVAGRNSPSPSNTTEALELRCWNSMGGIPKYETISAT